MTCKLKKSALNLLDQLELKLTKFIIWKSISEGMSNVNSSNQNGCKKIIIIIATSHEGAIDIEVMYFEWIFFMKIKKYGCLFQTRPQFLLKQRTMQENSNSEGPVSTNCI